MATWTNGGISLAATAMQTSSVDVAITYADIVVGAGTLSTGLTSGVSYSSLSLNVGVPAIIASGQSLLISNGAASQVVTTSLSIPIGSTTIAVNLFTASANFAANTTAVSPIPQTTDTALYNGTNAVRVAANVGTAGSNPGESLTSAYFDGTQPTNVYMLVGYFGGSTATSTPGTGTLMIADNQYWNHTNNVDSNMYQADYTI